MSSLRRGALAFVVAAGGLIGAPVAAELSPQDVLDSFTDTYAALGLRYVGTLTEDDGTLTMEAGHLHFALPMGLGDLISSHPDLILRPLGDGTVEVTFPPRHDGGVTASLSLSFGPVDDAQIVLAIDMTLVTEGNVMIVSGTPDEMVFRTTTELMDLTFANLRGAGLPELDSLDLFIGLRATGTETVTILTALEDRLEMAFGTISGETIVETMIDELFDDRWLPEPFRQLSVSVTVIDRTESMGWINLPRAPLDLLDLAAALNDGLVVEITTSSEGQISQSVIYEDDALVSEQDQRAGLIRQQLLLDAGGLSISGTAQDMTLSFKDNFLGNDPIDLALALASGEFKIPLARSPEPQELKFALALDDLSLSPATWDLFDDRAALGRDAMSLEMQLALGMQLDADLLDFRTLMDLGPGDVPPVALTRIGLDHFNFQGLGLDIKVSGDFDLPPDFLDIFGSQGLPVGSGRMEMSGFDRLLDTLSASGVLPRAEVSGLRIGLAAISRADGPDRVVSELEINEDGHVILNGQRVQ
ncbi:MAG: DUF2125 domain-containing protein [Rubellimicrobium sp.]|nr:DUF2125 domain-containing protein [Rubellimicrobium sp.]